MFSLRSVLSIALLMALFVPSIEAAHKRKPQKSRSVEHFLAGRIPIGDKRHDTLAFAMQLMQRRGATTIIETGTSRLGASNPLGDGCFTIIVGDYVREMGGVLYSVDIDPQAIATCAAALGHSRNYVQLFTQDSVAFLENFKDPIDFLYLDSYDYVLDNPNPSQEHHLNEIIAAYPKLTRKSVVMIDDCGLPGGGKGKLAIEFLVSRGWKILMNGYQVILSQE
ncbi:MAG: class I SAM-dependent methyltransferase [Chlamydiales bacterium]|nr:class I SAM-dependent methyltransferase [Chlamydiales bacterium]